MEGLNNMGVMDIENFNEDYITTELINTGSCPRILVSLNDINAFKFTKIFVDGTDILVRGSRHYMISRKQFDALLFLGDLNLLHDGTKEGMAKHHEIDLLPNPIIKLQNKINMIK